MCRGSKTFLAVISLFCMVGTNAMAGSVEVLHYRTSGGEAKGG